MSSRWADTTDEEDNFDEPPQEETVVQPQEVSSVKEFCEDSNYCWSCSNVGLFFFVVARTDPKDGTGRGPRETI